jgi:hypothetical protein
LSILILNIHLAVFWILWSISKADIQNPGFLWKLEDLWTIMTAAFLLHNLIIEDKQDTPVAKQFDYHTLDTQNNNPAVSLSDAKS